MSARIAWGARVTPEFLSAVRALCTRLWHENILSTSRLMACMAFESAETFSPTIKNAAGSGAIGLIQFMPATARGLGTTSEKLAEMTGVQQLQYVERYFAPYAPAIHSLSDMYMAILMPFYIGKPDHSVLFSAGAAYRQNSGLDANRDGKVTKLEATGMVQAKLDKGFTIGYGITLPA